LIRIKDARQRSCRQCADEHRRASTAPADASVTDRNLVLDVRGMEPPEPFERVLETIDDFVPGDRLKLIIDCRPAPLFRYLDRHGYEYSEMPGTESAYEITIRRRS
jgi:TusA-related sulfurtransferase